MDLCLENSEAPFLSMDSYRFTACGFSKNFGALLLITLKGGGVRAAETSWEGGR